MKFPAFEPIDLKNVPQSFDAIDLPLSKIEPNENQPIKIFNEDTLNELALSIKQHGVIQPIIVRKIEENKRYQIIAGERRWRASVMAGLEKIPAIIKEYDNASRMAVALIENIQRANLNPLEEAEALRSLIEECAMTHNQIAESIVRSRTAVSNLLRLLELTQEVKIMISSGLLEMGHGRALLSLSCDQQIQTARLIVSKSLSVRETEKLVRNKNTPQEKSTILMDHLFKKKAQVWKTNFSKQISSRVNVHFGPEGEGKIVIYFDSLEKSDWLMEHLKIEE